MWRYRGDCRHCGQASAWYGDREEGRQEIIRHLAEFHGIAGASPRIIRYWPNGSATLAWSLTWMTAPNAAMISAGGMPATSTDSAAGVSDYIPFYYVLSDW